ncbi:DUF6882 domain-containing protein [Tenacibaculum finnmarkense]|uniref:DUF6882 domain-containing protein n=1 Tax=Tenacibaculum finnmarkense TaxID=2781243 RepID=UPI001E5D60AE|nr:DUF6882 domain-containing protein [Tenacibaculum finnmarkense]MCD8403837.1 hypothetical protein [Tenacibaculum finnmarkense genomovar finnmarkense]
MIFRPLKYKKYAEKSCQELNEFQNGFRKKYDTDNYENWFYNQSSEILRLYSENKEIYFKYIPVGTFSQKKNTWFWSWANKSSVEPRKFQTLKVKEFGEKKNYENLTNKHFGGDNFTGWELTSIAFEIIGGIGTYRVISDDLEKYFLLTEEITKEEVEKIESELIDCGVHGKLRQAFICQHLNSKQKTGFEEAFETYRGMELDEEDDFQAWCSECEKERIKTNGWNDESMEFAKINLVCEKCYFEIKEINE